MNTLKLATILGLSLLLSACTDALYKVQGERPVSKDRPLSVVNGNALDRSENLERLEEKHFKRLLETTLKKYGYNLHQANSNQKPCFLFFELKQSTHDMIGSYTTYNTSTTFSNTSGWVGGSYVYGRGTSTTTTPSTNTYTYQVTFQNVYTLFACPDNTGKNQPIWEGAMSAELADYDNNKEDAIANLVGLMEFDKFRGKLRIDTDKHVPFIKKHNKRKHYVTLGGDVAFSIGSADFGTYHYTDKWGKQESKDLSDFSPLSAPVTLRMGYMYDPKKSVAFGINTLYQIDNMSDDFVGIAMSAKTQRIGVEATMLIKNSVLIGLGMAKNINSSATIHIYDYDYKTQFDQKINATYGLWRLEYLYNIPATTFYLTTGMSGGWSLQDIDYAGSMFALTAGLLYKL